MAKNICNTSWLIVLSAVLFLAPGCKGQKTYGTEYLELKYEISLPGVRGRIDHIDVDVKNKIAYIAALANNTIEIVDLQGGKRIHTITGLDEPQGVSYVPDRHEIFVANGGNGECYFYNADNFQKTATIKLDADADDTRYDSTTQRIYVGYGSGGIAVIDVLTHKQIGNVPLAAHPESFQLDNNTGKIFINVPGAGLVAVININTLAVTDKWKRSALHAQFPMALDLQNRKVLVGYRSPARLEINDENGQSVNTYPMVGDADDLYYDESKKRIYVSGGGGYINIFQQQDINSYAQIANIPTRVGARTSFFSSALQLLIVAARSGGGKEAALVVYKVNDK